MMTEDTLTDIEYLDLKQAKFVLHMLVASGRIESYVISQAIKLSETLIPEEPKKK